jgi:hypothetical protein
VPPRQSDAGLRPKLEVIGTADAFLEPSLGHHIDALEASPPALPPTSAAPQKTMITP